MLCRAGLAPRPDSDGAALWGNTIMPKQISSSSHLDSRHALQCNYSRARITEQNIRYSIEN